jgi:phosphonate transport system substrate-binding protein
VRALQRLALGLLVALCGAFATAWADDKKPLAFGVFPSLTARQTVEVYQPLADIIGKKLQRRVVVYSARDFKTFVARTRAGDYDIVLTAPHLAWLARQDAGYRPLLKYAQPVYGMLVTRADSPLQTVESLRGRTIATADAIAVAVMAVQAELAARGLRANVDYHTLDAGTHVNAMMQVINGRADGAIIGVHPYRLLAADLRAQLRVVTESPRLSSLMYLTHPRLRDREAGAVRQTLYDFAATAEGEAFMQRGGYGGFAEIDGTELRAFRPYALQAQDMLRAMP